jgi:hypothetical protein
MGRAIPCLARRRRIRETTSPWDPLSDAKTTIVSFSKPNFFSASSIVPMTASPSKGWHACLPALALDGFIVGSRQTIASRFTPDGPFPPKAYVGVISTVGLDIGLTGGGALACAVFAPTEGPPRSGLAGAYVGASGDVGVGVGLGANVLFGGSNRTVALQPVSVEGQVGVTSPWGFRNSSSARRHDAMRAASSGTGFIRSPRRRWRAARHASTFGRVGAGACFD